MKTEEEWAEEKQGEPIAYINVEQRKLEWSKYTSWETPTVVNLPKIPLYTKPQPRKPLTDEEKDLQSELERLKQVEVENKRLASLLSIARSERNALRAELDALKSQEPVACVGPRHYERLTLLPRSIYQTFEREQPLYAKPQTKEWVGLTDEEIDECDWGQSERDHARAIEAKLKEKNT